MRCPPLALSLAAPIWALALAAPALAQDAPASQPAATGTLRVSLSAQETVDDVPVEPNIIQAFLFTELHQAGLRVDSLRDTGQKAYEKWIKQQEANWAKKEPDAPAAELAIEVVQKATYNGAKFYGETQAHVFKGGVEITLKAGGEVVVEFSFPFEWGKAIQVRNADGSIEHRTKPDVRKQFDQMVQKAVVCWLLSQEQITSKLDPKAKAKAAKAVKTHKAYLLKILDGSTGSIREGEMASFLRAIPDEG